MPATTTIDELRTHLASMFPEVASATVQKGTKEIEGVKYETIEFVKKAGTKGSMGAEVAGLLATIPALRLGGPPPAAAALLERISLGLATIDEALEGQALAALAALPQREHTRNGGTLCSQLDAIIPVAGAAPSVW